MELKMLWRFLKLPGIFITGAILYIISKYIMNGLMTDVVGANISTWHPLARVIIPLLPIIAFIIFVVFRGFLVLNRGDADERRRRQGYGNYPPEE
jgi:hypothetical protein